MNTYVRSSCHFTYFRACKDPTMKLPTVGNFLGCCDLKTGTLVIGIFQLVASTILLLVCTVLLAGGSLVVSGALGDDVNQKVKEAEEQLNDDEKAFAKTLAMFAFVSTCIMVILCMFNTVVCSLLVHGARNRRACLMVPWIVVAVFNICCCLIGIIAALAVGKWSTAVGQIIADCIIVYSFLVVTSFKKEIGGPPHVLMQPTVGSTDSNLGKELY